MTLRVSGKNMNIGDALRQHVTERLGATAARFLHRPPSGHVTVAPEGSGFRADCTLHLPSGVTVQADGRAQEPYACFDQAADRIEKRLRRYKERLKSHHGHSTSASDGEVVSDYVIESLDEEADAPTAERYSPIVIAETTSRLTRMSVSAAVIEFDLTGAPVLTFRHDVSGRVNVIYRRPDGNIGWIDIGPEDAGRGAPAAADSDRARV